MELLSVIVALEALKKTGLDITIYSDSKYVVDSVSKGWVFGWSKKNFKGKKNPDLWQRFIRIYQVHKPKFIWIKGHAANRENEYCDRLAVKSANTPPLEIDYGYENGLEK